MQPLYGDFAAAAYFTKDQPWTTHGGLAAAGAVRAAVLSVCMPVVVDGTEITKFTPRIGGEAAASGRDLWCEWIDEANCLLTYGQVVADGRIEEDWVLRVTIGEGVVVGTNSYRTYEDELLNGQLHDALSRAIVREFATGGGQADTLETYLSADSLSRRVAQEPIPMETGVMRLRFECGATPAAVSVALGAVNTSAKRTQSDGAWTWILGLPGSGSSDHAAIHRTDRAGAYVGEATLSRTGTALHRRIAHEQLRRWFSQVRSNMKDLGPIAAWESRDFDWVV